MNIERFKGTMELIKLVQSNLMEIIIYYGYATVADYYELIGHTSKYTDNKKGWTSLTETTIVMTDATDIYELVLPEPLDII